MIYGYARCSTNESKQDISRQTRQLKEMGATNKTIYYEYESGAKTDRAELLKLLDIVNAGDTIISTEVSRITRSTKQLIDIIELAKEKQLKLIFGTFIVDCSKDLDPMTEGMLTMMGVFAEIERNMIKQRIKSGVANAQAKAKAEGREYRPSARTTLEDIPNNFKRYYMQWKDGAFNKSELARLTGLSRPSVNKYIEIIEMQEIPK